MISSLVVAILTLVKTCWTEAPIIECLTSHDVPFETQASFNWSSLILPYNLRLSWEPSIVTLPYTASQVSGSVICAAESGLKVQAKSGGHSYASFSTGGRNGSLIVNLQNFHSIDVNEYGIAKVGAGVRLGNLALGVFNQGKRALPHGVCPGVGIGGHFTHGGYGYQSRLWGLALDSIVAMDVVLANGSYIHTTATEYPDIFYAMRGAADSFGIVTHFYLKTHPAPSSIITFSASIHNAFENPDILSDAFLRLQATALDPRYMTSNVSFSIYLNSNGTFSLRGWCIECDLTQVKETLFPKLLEGFPTPFSKPVKSYGWIDALVRLAEGTPLDVPLYAYDLHEKFAGKSVVTKSSEPLTRVQWLSYWTFVKEKALGNAPTSWYSILDMYGGAGSQINALSSDSSSFSHRDTLWVIQNNAVTPNNEEFPNKSARVFLEEFTNSITSGDINDFGIYLNCADPDLSPIEVAERGYGRDTYNRLLAIKKEVDPDFIFWNPHAIGNVGPLPPKDALLEKQKLELRSTSPNNLTTSTDGTCGGNITCSGFGDEGTCCSNWGQCVPPVNYPGNACLTTNGCQEGLGPCLQVSSNGRCGGDTGFVCTGSSYGPCCSEAGWCGSTNQYCNSRCQGKAGLCLSISPDGTCGLEVGYTCLGSRYGSCCSGSGFCGATADYCSLEKGCLVSTFDNPLIGICLEGGLDGSQLKIGSEE